MKYQDDKVITGNVVLAWDGLRNPEHRQSGSVDYNVSVLINRNAPEIAELTEIYQKALNESEFRGTLPPGGNNPLTKVVDPAKYGPEYNNHISIKAGTTRGIPPIMDASGNQLDAMTFGPMLYPGCVMQLLVDAYAYNNVQKGINFGLQAIKIVDASAPKLPVGGGMSPAEAAAAMMGGAAPATSAPVAPPGQGPAAPGPGPGAPLAPPAAPTGPVMTAQAQYTYDQYIAAGWTDEQLRTNGLIV